MKCVFYIVKHEDLVDYKSSCFGNEKHQTRVSLLLELVSNAYFTANRTDYLWSSRQETSPLDHTRLFGQVVISPAWKTTGSRFDSQ